MDTENIIQPEKSDVTVRVSPETKDRLNALKKHPRETYADVIFRLISGYKANNQ